jgi:hypothetical protein
VIASPQSSLFFTPVFIFFKRGFVLLNGKKPIKLCEHTGNVPQHVYTSTYTYILMLFLEQAQNISATTVSATEHISYRTYYRQNILADKIYQRTKCSPTKVSAIKRIGYKRICYKMDRRTKYTGCKTYRLQNVLATKHIAYKMNRRT